MKIIVEVRNGFKHLNREIVLEDVTFYVKEGKLVSIFGLDKSVKNILMKSLAGLEFFDEGELFLFGEDPYQKDFGRRNEVFFIHDDYDLLFPMNFLEMIKLYRSVYPRWSNQTFNTLRKERKFSIRKDFNELSRTHKKQLLLITALAVNPKVIFIDDFASGLDIEAQRYFLKLLKKFTKDGGAVIMTSGLNSELRKQSDLCFTINGRKLELMRGEEAREQLVA